MVGPERIAYGDGEWQFGDLWLPPDQPTAVVVLVHGGFWRKIYGLDLMDPLAADLVARGVAAWNIEYRRVGHEGGAGRERSPTSPPRSTY
jgi:acetyl esterase/lipase